MKSAILVEHIVAAAERRGELQNLPGAGRPQHDELAGLDEDARLDAILGRSGGGASLEVDLRREVAELRAQLAAFAGDDVDRAALRQQLIDRCVRLSVVHEARGHRLLANDCLDFMPG